MQRRQRRSILGQERGAAALNHRWQRRQPEGHRRSGHQPADNDQTREADSHRAEAGQTARRPNAHGYPHGVCIFGLYSQYNIDWRHSRYTSNECTTSARKVSAQMRQLPATIASKLYGAAELIAERGITEAKMDDIAAASGIPRATLYYYFTGKEEILAFLLTDMLEAIAGEVGAAVGTPGTARERLEAAVHAQIAVMLDQPAACRALVGDLGRATRLPELAHALQEAFQRPIEQLLAEGAADGSLHVQSDPEDASLAIFGAITVAGLYHAVEDTRPPAEQIAKRVLAVLMQGLAG